MKEMSGGMKNYRSLPYGTSQKFLTVDGGQKAGKS